MTPDDPSGPRPNPVVLRIKLRYDDVEVMVQRFAPNVGKSGLFLPTRSMQPLGTELKFELRLANDQPVLVGLGRVKSMKEHDPDDPKAVYGLGVELLRVTRESRDLILRMLERRRRLGIADAGVPTPADVDAARRAIDDDAARSVAPVAVASVESHGEGLLTAPRPAAAVPSAKLHVVEPLAAEPPRKRRPLISEVIESASGPLGAVTVPGLDDDVDVGAAIARARLLATGDLDGELEALREQSAAPLLEITIDAASAELARQLGGAAVRRERSQRSWAPPPAVVTEQPADLVAEARPEPEGELEAPATALSPEPMLPSYADEDDLDPGIISRDASDEAHLARASSGQLIDDDANPADFGGPQPEEHEVDDGQIDDEIHQLSEADFEDLEHTQIGASPEALEDPGYVADPGASAELAERLDAHLAEAEAEAEADDLGLRDVPYEDLSAERAISVGGEYESAYVEERPSQHGYEGASGASVDDEEEIAEEIEEFEILAEADADDADLLASHGEVDITGSGSVIPGPGAAQLRRPSLSDFASRLDLDDESDLYPQPPEPGYYERRRNISDELPRHAEIDPRALSAGHALAQFEDDNLTPNPGAIPQPYGRADSQGTYTLAEDLDPPHSAFSPPHEFDQSDVIAIPAELAPPLVAQPQAPPARVLPMPAPPRRPEPRALGKPPEDYDLETALEALDVDLDDISIPRPAVPPRRAVHQTGSARIVGPAPITPAGRQKRPPTDDGIVIDFDDDDD